MSFIYTVCKEGRKIIDFDLSGSTADYILHLRVSVDAVLSTDVLFVRNVNAFCLIFTLLFGPCAEPGVLFVRPVLRL